MYWTTFALGATLSSCVLFYKIFRLKANFMADPHALSATLFLLTFYIPMYLLPGEYSWYHFSEASIQVVLVANIFIFIGHKLGAVRFRNIHEVNFLHKSFFTIPQTKYCIFLWFSGIVIYLLMYSIKGVPVLSGNVDYARQTFLSGYGFILQPAQILINMLCLVFVLRNRFKSAIFFGVIGIFIILLSGWRGTFLSLIISILIILSVKRSLSYKVFLYGLICILTISLIGILRAYSTGNSIYGLKIESVFDIFYASVLYVVLRLGIHADTLNIVVGAYDGMYLYGDAILMDLSGVFGGGEKTVVYFLKNKFADWEGGGGFPPTMFGAFFMDFGIIGVAILSLFTAFIYSWLMTYFTKKAKSNEFFYLFIAALAVAWFTAFLGTYFKYFISIMIFHLIAYSAVCFSALVLRKKIKLR